MLIFNNSYCQIPNEFHLYNSETDTIKVENIYSETTTIYPFNENTEITGLSFTGMINHSETNSILRIILIDTTGYEFLVLESYPLLTDSLSQYLQDYCEETNYLNEIVPAAIKIELLNSQVEITNFKITKQTQPSFNYTLANNRHNTQIQYKISKIKTNILKYNLTWNADSTNFSHKWQNFKKNISLFSITNYLQGVEYYKDGIYDIISHTDISYPVNNFMTDHFDWRSKHNATSISSPYFNNSISDQGWITSVKSQVPYGTCYTFSKISCIEALTNLYYNNFISPDLSEEQDACCCPNNGIVNEECFPYDTNNMPSAILCDNICDSSEYAVSEFTLLNLMPISYLNYNPDSIMKWLIKYGPLQIDMIHFSCLIGYYYNPFLNKIVWKFKDSLIRTLWDGTAGILPDNYFYTSMPYSHIFKGAIAILSPINMTNKSTNDIRCLDLDTDGYYNWGIGPKPPHCPVSPQREDCDDSDPSFGPMDVDGSCSRLVPYSYGFDSTNIVDWKQSRTDDFNWTVITGSTPTSLTGPDAPSQGDAYIYSEGTGNESLQASLISPSLYITSSCNIVQFSYHMYGSTMGNLEVFVSEDGGINWTSQKLLTGDHGNQWDTAYIELCGYDDKIIKIKFVSTIGNDEFSDIAIDDFKIYENILNLNLNSNSPLCVNDTIKLSSQAGFYSYSWTGPNNFTSNNTNPTLVVTDTLATG